MGVITRLERLIVECLSYVSGQEKKYPGGTSILTVTGTCRWGGGGGENLTLSQTARRTKNTPCHNIPYLKRSYAYPVRGRERERGGGGVGGVGSFAIERWFKVRWYWYVRTLYSAVYHHTFIKNLLRPARTVHRRWCRNRGPDINTVSWEATLW